MYQTYQFIMIRPGTGEPYVRIYHETRGGKATDGRATLKTMWIKSYNKFEPDLRFLPMLRNSDLLKFRHLLAEVKGKLFASDLLLNAGSSGSNGTTGAAPPASDSGFVGSPCNSGATTRHELNQDLAMLLNPDGSIRVPGGDSDLFAASERTFWPEDWDQLMQDF
jgi:hypothetical protein